MGGLPWLLAAVGVLSTLYDLPTWKNYLGTADIFLPLLSAANSKICYFFDLSQTCSAQAFGDLLGISAPTDVSALTATQAQCETLLDKQRIYAENVARSVFSPAIDSAATDSLANFELMVQSWVLRVGHYELAITHTAFVAALNSISDWTTVKCEGANFKYNSVTLTKPGFLNDVDCEVLGFLYQADCTNSSCSLDDAAVCCMAVDPTNCCNEKFAEVNQLCASSGCPYQTFCCYFGVTSNCCTG